MSKASLSFINCGSCFTPVLSKGKWPDERCECNWEVTNSISMLVIPWSENVVEYRNCNSGICHVMLCEAVFSVLCYIMLCHVSCAGMSNSLWPHGHIAGSPPGSSVHWILQARILEWVAISFSRVSSPPRGQTCVSHIGRGILNHWATSKAHLTIIIPILMMRQKAKKN